MTDDASSAPAAAVGKGTSADRQPAATDGAETWSDPRKNGIVANGTHGASATRGTGAPDAISVRGGGQRSDLPPRALLEMAYARTLTSLRGSNSATRDVDVDRVIDNAAKSVLMPGWDPASYHDVGMATARKVQNSSVVANFSYTLDVIALRFGIQAHELNAKLPDVFARRMYRAVVDQVPVLWGSPELQQSLVASTRRYATGPVGDLVDALADLGEVREVMTTYDRNDRIGSDVNVEATEQLADRVKTLRETFDGLLSRSGKGYSPSQRDELLFCASYMSALAEGAQYLLASAYKYKAGPLAFRPDPDAADVADIMQQLNRAEPESAQRFAFYRIDYGMEQLGAHLAVLAKAVGGELPPFVNDRYVQARMGAVLEKASKSSVKLPDDHETLPSFEVTLTQGDFHDVGGGGVPGHYSFKVAADDTLYIVAHDRNDAVWQATWPHHLAKPGA